MLDLDPLPGVERLWDPERSVGQHCAIHLRRAIEAVDADRPSDLDELYALMTPGWNEQPCSQPPFRNYPAYSPMEFSLVLKPGRRAAVRFAAECQFHLREGRKWDEFVALSQTLRTKYRAELGIFEAMHDALRPQPGEDFEQYRDGFGIAPLRGRWAFRAYVRRSDPSRVLRALADAGFPRVAERVSALVQQYDMIDMLAVDLIPGAAATVKLYVRHGVTRTDEWGSLAADHEPGLHRAFLDALLPPAERVPIGYSALQLHPGRDEVASEIVAMEFMHWHYVHPDGTKLPDAHYVKRISDLLETHGIDPAPYHAFARSFARTRLGREYLMHSNVTFKRDDGVPTVTVYLNPRCYAYVKRAG